jgi:hypothetical protein
MLRKPIGRRLQAVVHMNGMHLPGPAPRTGNGKRSRIGPATEP